MSLDKLPGMLWIVYDLLALGILIHFVRRAASRGFVRTLVNFSGYLLAALVAGALGPVAARQLYTYIVRDALALVVSGQIEAVLTDGAGALSGFVTRFLPAELLEAVQSGGGEFLETIFDGDIGAMTSAVVDGALQAPVLSILGGVCFFLVFSVAMIFTRHVGRLFGGLYRVPVIGTFNTFLGGVVGVAQGLLVLYLLAVLLHIVLAATGGGTAFINEQVIGEGFIFRVFYAAS